MGNAVLQIAPLPTTTLGWQQLVSGFSAAGGREGGTAEEVEAESVKFPLMASEIP